jgi:FlaA1/EpsC-like NDP-sugar epimerase
MTPVVSRYTSNLLRLLMDVVVIAVSFYVAVVLRFLDVQTFELGRVLPSMKSYVVPLIILYVGIGLILRLDRRVWQYATAADVIPIFWTVTTSALISVAADLELTSSGARPVPLSVLLLGAIFSFCGLVAVRYWRRLIYGFWPSRGWAKTGFARTLIYGAGETGQAFAWRVLTQAEGRDYRLVGYVDDDQTKRGLRIHSVRVLGSRKDLAHLVERERVDLIVLAVSTLTGENLRSILSIAQETTAQIKILPNLFETMSSRKEAPLVREIRVQDLLGRQPAVLDGPACEAVLRNKVVLVTGGCGSVGSELCRQTAAFSPEHLVILDNNESGLYDLEIEIRAQHPDLLMTFVVGDVTDEVRMDRLFAATRPQVIFHAAAYKHVPLMQIYPEEAVRVNVGGTQCALTMARRYGAQVFVLVSTDKAVNPGSVMGATKRVAEFLLVSPGKGRSHANGDSERTPPLCTAVRFGNVLGSRGSVVPTFARQIELGGPVTVTHPEMTRYFIDVSEAATLIIQAAGLTEGNDTFMLEMGQRIRVDDLARKMIRMRGLRPDIDIPIVYTGIRPGEKLHEELIHAEDEVARTSHPAIYRVKSRSADQGRVMVTGLERLLSLAAQGFREELVRELMTLCHDPAPAPSDEDDVNRRPPVAAVRIN